MSRRTREETSQEIAAPRSAVLSLYSNERLNDDGTPNPLLVGRNKIELGYTCPEREYIESINPPSPAYLARKWGVDESWLELLHDKQDWPARRAREWLRVEKLAFDSSKERIAEIRNAEQARQRGDLMMVRDLLTEKVKDGRVIETTSTGQIFERPLSVKELKDVADAFNKINDGINNSLGIQKNLGRLDDGNVADTGAKIRRVTHRHVETRKDGELTTTTERIEELPEARELPALPEGSRVYEAIPQAQKNPST